MRGATLVAGLAVVMTVSGSVAYANPQSTPASAYVDVNGVTVRVRAYQQGNQTYLNAQDVAAAVRKAGDYGQWIGHTFYMQPYIQDGIQPSDWQIVKELETAYETGTHDPFVPVAGPFTVPDGHGGYLTLVEGLRSPSVDGQGRQLFFWHNNQFAGMWQIYELGQVGAIQVEGRDIVVNLPRLDGTKQVEKVYFRWRKGGLWWSGHSPAFDVVGGVWGVPYYMSPDGGILSPRQVYYPPGRTAQ